MRRLALALAPALVLASTACASADPNARQSGQDRIIVTSDPGGVVADFNIQRPDYVGAFVVKDARDRLWSQLPAVYTELGLPAPVMDESIWTVEVRNHTATRRIGDIRMSQILDCGSDMTGQLADTHRIRLSVRTWLEPAGGENTEVRTRVDALASSMERSATFSCSSRGELEARIAQALEERTAQ
jgi:hypothetical protein